MEEAGASTGEAVVAAGFTAGATEEDIGEVVPTGVRAPLAALGLSAAGLLVEEATTGAEALLADPRAATEPTGDRTAGSIHRAE